MVISGLVLPLRTVSGSMVLLQQESVLKSVDGITTKDHVDLRGLSCPLRPCVCLSSVLSWTNRLSAITRWFWWWCECRTEGLTTFLDAPLRILPLELINSATIQAQIQGFELVHPNTYPICKLLEHTTASRARFYFIIIIFLIFYFLKWGRVEDRYRRTGEWVGLEYMMRNLQRLN